MRPAIPVTHAPGRAASVATIGICSLSLFVIAVDTTVVNLALPLIGHSLRTPVSGLQWTIAAYTVTTASLMLTAGAIGDRFGRRSVLQAGLALFVLGSLAASLAPSVAWLVAGRALQGAGGAALTPMSLGVITATFTDPAARARAIGIWTGTFGAGMAAGPVLGGVLAATWGWRSVFWITIPPGVLAAVLAGLVIPGTRLVPGTQAVRARRLDLPGQALVIAFLACLTYGIIEGPAAHWRSPVILSAFAVSAVALVLLVPWERRRPEPLIDLRAFRSIPFTSGLVITLCAFASLGGFLFLATLYLQDARDLTVWQAGLRLLPLAVAAFAAGPIAGRALASRGGRWPLILAGAALGLSSLILAQVPALSWTVLALASAVFGAGYGAVNTVISAVAVAGLPPARAGVAGGISSAARQAGQSLGVSVTGAVLAAGLHGSIGYHLVGASHPAWLVIAACGLAVVPLGVLATCRRARRTAALVDAAASRSDAGDGSSFSLLPTCVSSSAQHQPGTVLGCSQRLTKQRRPAASRE